MRTQQHAGRWATSLFALALVSIVPGRVLAQGAGYAVTPEGNFGNLNPGYPTNEAPRFAIDNSPTTKYLNFGAPETVTGLIITPASGATTVSGIRFTTANDAPGRDPLTFNLEGSNTGPNGTFTPIAAGLTGLTTDPGRTTAAAVQNFLNSLPFTSYRLTFPTLRMGLVTDNTNNSMQIAEIELLNAAGQDVTSPTDAVVAIHLVPEPGSITLVALGALGLLRRSRR